jgi:hypothetical protein
VLNIGGFKPPFLLEGNMIKCPGELVQRFNVLASNVEIPYSWRRKMINPLLFLTQMFVIDITAFGEWMEETYPEYRDKSIRQFLEDKDPQHIEEWKEILLGGKQ